MIEVVEAITTALSSGVNPVTAIREATGYTIEQMAVTSGLATSEIADLEASATGDEEKVARLLSSLGLPESLIRT